MEGIIASPLDWSAPVLPLHLLFMLWALAVGLLLTRLHKFRKFDGQVLLSFLFVHEAGKFLLEFLRVPSVPLVQIGSLVVSVLAGFALLGLWLRNRPQSAGVQIT